MSYLRFIVMSSIFRVFFFLMIRRPPRSTLFPTRRSSDLLADNDPTYEDVATKFFEHFALIAQAAHQQRSEEHTSELQSQSNLVCRLLLEKKKNSPRARHPTFVPYYYLNEVTPDKITPIFV